MEEAFFKFAHTAWQFSRADGSIIIPRLEFQLGGRIRFSRYANESFWTVKNGNLCFVGANHEVTTEFTDCVTDEVGNRTLRGRFLPAASVTHVLTELPTLGIARIPTRPPRVAVLIRTHVVNEKIADLLAVLSSSACFDLFVCADCTRAELEFYGVPVLRHRAEDAHKMGFRTNIHNLMWHCGDYAFYFAYNEIPDYDYYVMVEYDVDFVDRSPLLIEGLINRLEFSRPGMLDFVGCRCQGGNFERGWGVDIAGFYPEPHLCQFPFVVLSRSALEFLIDERRAERRSSIAPDRVMFCEAFVPSALHAGGFRRADINSLIPGAVTEATFRIPGKRGPLLLGQRDNLPPTIQLLHPVYDERNFVAFYLAKARREQNGAGLAALLGANPPLPLSNGSLDLIRQCMAELPITPHSPG